MIDLFPYHLKCMVKSGLRDARHAARKLGTAARNNGDRIDTRLPPGSGQLIGKIVDYSDSTLVVMETIALDILSRGKHRAAQTAGPQPLERYFGSGSSGQGRFLLAQDGYVAIKQIMRIKAVPDFRVSESSLEDAHGIALAKMPKHLQSGYALSTGQPLETVAIVAACMAQGVARSLVVHEPPELYDPQRDCVQQIVPFIAAAFALSCAAVTYHRDLGPDDDIYSAVCSAIDSRYARLAAALVPGALPDDLSRIFVGMLPHIP